MRLPVDGLPCPPPCSVFRRSAAAVSLAVVVILTTATAAVTPAAAQKTGEMPGQLEGAGIEPQLGAQIPLGLTFRNEAGEDVTLARYFDGERPVLLVPVYLDCPMLCNLVLHGLTEAFGRMEWVPGGEFEVVAVSFNPRETPQLAADEKQRYVDMLGKPEAAEGWHFLTGEKAAIDSLMDALGFEYRWVEEEQVYAHASALTFLSGDGKLSRYLHGIEYQPRDVRNALVEASDGTIGSAVDQVILYCFQYDPSANSYVPHALNLMKLGGVLTVLLLGTFLFVFWRRESRQTRERAAA